MYLRRLLLPRPELGDYLLLPSFATSRLLKHAIKDPSVCGLFAPSARMPNVPTSSSGRRRRRPHRFMFIFFDLLCTHGSLFEIVYLSHPTTKHFVPVTIL